MLLSGRTARTPPSYPACLASVAGARQSEGESIMLSPASDTRDGDAKNRAKPSPSEFQTAPVEFGAINSPSRPALTPGGGRLASTGLVAGVMAQHGRAGAAGTVRWRTPGGLNLLAGTALSLQGSPPPVLSR